MALNSTPKDPSAEAYISVADATTFINAYGTDTEISSWGSLTTANQERFLRLGTQVLESSYDFISVRTTDETGETAQALEFPRYDVPRDGYDELSNPNAVLLDNDTVPEPIKRANVYMAISYSSSDLQADIALSELKSLKSGEEEFVWRDANEMMGIQGNIPSKVHDLVRRYGILKPSLNSGESELKTISNRSVWRS